MERWLDVSFVAQHAEILGGSRLFEKLPQPAVRNYRDSVRNSVHFDQA
jgi:hypothetical protein